MPNILSARLSYFTSVDSGVILNRFSQDMAILNGQLPVMIFQAASGIHPLVIPFVATHN